jgi:hypothetical protein
MGRSNFVLPKEPEADEARNQGERTENVGSFGEGPPRCSSAEQLAQYSSGFSFGEDFFSDHQIDQFIYDLA